MTLRKVLLKMRHLAWANLLLCCYFLLKGLVDAGNTEQKQFQRFVLDSHNLYRSHAKLPHLTWNDTLMHDIKKTLKKFSKRGRCYVKHDEFEYPKRPSTGYQWGFTKSIGTLVAVPGEKTLHKNEMMTTVVNRMYEGASRYQYPGKGRPFLACKETKMGNDVKMFTQLMWAKTTSVACGYINAKCSRGSKRQKRAYQYYQATPDFDDDDDDGFDDFDDDDDVDRGTPDGTFRTVLCRYGPEGNDERYEAFADINFYNLCVNERSRLLACHVEVQANCDTAREQKVVPQDQQLSNFEYNGSQETFGSPVVISAFLSFFCGSSFFRGLSGSSMNAN